MVAVDVPLVGFQRTVRARGDQDRPGLATDEGPTVAVAGRDLDQPGRDLLVLEVHIAVELGESAVRTRPRRGSRQLPARGGMDRRAVWVASSQDLRMVTEVPGGRVSPVTGSLS